MDEKKFNDIALIVLVFLLLFSIIAGFTSTSYYKTRLERTRSELGQLRDDLESATNREHELENELREAFGYVQRESSLLKEGGTTIKEIRKQVEDLENYCNHLECYIRDIVDSFN